MTMVGLAFKLSAVPFHFWAPDVFEGAPAEVGTFLSIASKAAAVALLTRLALIFSGCLEPLPAARAAVAALAPVRFYLASLIALLAAVTCTFGNLAAYGQTNIKRLLAYSTIAHAGYLMMPVAAAVALAGDVAHRERYDRCRGGPDRLPGRLLVHELRRVRHRGLCPQRAAERVDRRLCRHGPPLARRGRGHGGHPLQPRRPAAAGRVFGQVRRLCRLAGRQDVSAR